MPTFQYKAINPNGNAVSGELDADTVDTVNSILGARGLIPDRVVEKDTGSSFFEGLAAGGLTPISPMDLVLFTKQLRTMLKAGIPILHILQVLENQTENRRLKKIIGRMAADIQTGATLNDSFKKHPAVFSSLYCSMVQAGEKSGALVDVLERLVYIIEHENKVKTEIKAAVRYPLFVLIFLGVAFFVLLTVVIPKFTGIFINANIDLPVPTRICLALYQFLNQYWLVIVLAVVGVVVALALYLKTEVGKQYRDAFLLKLPIIGKVFQKSAMSRFGSIFSILQASGVSILDTMNIVEGTIGNAAIAGQLARIRSLMAEGRGLSGPLKSSKYFSPMVIHMVAVGEETGNLDELLRDMSAHYDMEVEYATKKLSDSIAPILTIVLAAMVGFFALAIFLPMWDLTKLVK